MGRDLVHLRGRAGSGTGNVSIVNNGQVDGGAGAILVVNNASMDIVHGDLGETFEGAATSLGYQLEGGYRLFEINDGGVHVEPIAAVSYVRTKVDDLDIGPVAASFGVRMRW